MSSNPQTFIIPFKSFLTGGFFNLEDHIRLIFAPYSISISQKVHIAYEFNNYVLGIFDKTHWNTGKVRIDTALDSINTKFLAFYNAKNSYDKTPNDTTIKKSCLNALDDLEDILRIQLSINGPFRDDDISTLSLGYFTIIATIHILVLSYAILNGKKLGMIDIHIEDIKTQIKNVSLNYIRHANKSYKAGLDNTSSNLALFRKMCGDHIFDYVNGWSYIVNQINNYSKGVNFELIRDPRAEVFENPMVSYGIDDMNNIISKLRKYDVGGVNSVPGPNTIKSDAAYVIDVQKFFFKDSAATFSRDHIYPTFSTIFLPAGKSLNYAFKSVDSVTSKYSIAIKYHFSGDADKATMTFMYNGNLIGNPASFEKCEKSDGFNEYITKFFPGRIISVNPNANCSFIINTQNNIYIHSIIFIPSN